MILPSLTILCWLFQHWGVFIMITGIDRPTSGEVLVGDTAVPSLSEG